MKRPVKTKRSPEDRDKADTPNAEVHQKAPADKGNATKQPAGSATALISVNPGWSMGLIILACGFGVVLLLAGLWGEMAITLDGVLSTTLIVSGLALIFAAFGAQATVQYKGWVIAGVAAIALIFLYAVHNLRNDSYVVVELVSSKTPSTAMRAGSGLILKGAVETVGDQLRTRFFVRYKDVSDDALGFDVEMPKVNEKASEKPVHLICFQRTKLVRWFGRGGYLNWRLNETEMAVYDQDKKAVGSKKDCGVELASTIRSPNLLISSAFAQGAANVDTLIEDLLSENTDVRRLARERLADQGPSVVRPVMKRANEMTAAKHKMSFRMRVGAAVAIDGMIQKGTKSDKAFTPDAVRKEFVEGDFKAIVDWSLNEDVSLRVPAVRILATTADVAALNLLMKEIEDFDDEDDVVYNTAWILRQSAQRLKSDQAALSQVKQMAIKLSTRKVGPKTEAFLTQTREMK